MQTMFRSGLAVVVVIALFMLNGCSSDQNGEATQSAPEASAPVSAPAAVEPTVAEVAPPAVVDLAAALAAPSRSDEDKARDASRKPEQVLAFLGVQPGMTAMDIMSGGGYYAEVLAGAVGSDGTVYAHNFKRALERREGANEKGISARLADSRLPNVQRWDNDAELALNDSVDVAVWALNMHDVFVFMGDDMVKNFTLAVCQAIKPGGAVAVIDHIGAAGSGADKELHRIDPALIEQALLDGGFIVEAKSDLLSNPDDDHTLGVFDPAIRGNTDRLLFLARKPASS